MRNVKIKGDNNAPITDYSGAHIGSIIQNESGIKETTVNFLKRETSINELLTGKLKETIVSMILGGAAYGSKIFLDKHNLDINFRIIFIALMTLFIIAAFVIICCVVFDLFKSFFLRRRGKFIELQSKSNFINLILKEIFNDKTTDNYRTVGKLYKNINGKIYEIMGCKCPFCETEPTGVMHFRFNKQTNTYELVCNEQPQHILTFDYKKEIEV